MKNITDELQGVVLVATDKTDEIRALRKAARERDLVSKVTQVAKNREAFRLLEFIIHWIRYQLGH